MFLISDDSWEVRQTKEKGQGIFCKKRIRAGTVISDYLGTAINTAEYDLETDKKGLYLMYYSDKISIYPDLSKPGPHLLNHSCAPNCWMYVYRGHTLFFALRDVEIDEELTISYLLDPNEGSCRLCTHMCMCKSENCSKTMHLSKEKYIKWRTFQNHEVIKTRKIGAVVGKKLPPLPSYPSKIPRSSIYKEMYS